MILYMRTAAERAAPPTALLEPVVNFSGLDEHNRVGARVAYRRLRRQGATSTAARGTLLQILRAGQTSSVELVTWPRHPRR